MTNKMSKSAQIRKYVAAHPTAKARQVADALGLKSAYVSSVMWAAKQKAKPVKVPKKTINLPKVGDTVGGLVLSEPMQVEMFEPKPDPVNHPAHYKYGGIETIDFIEAKELGYNLGNVVKYLTRADHKGNRKQDLEKAKWYLERELSTAT
jgi:hypothetical protein